MHSVPLVLTVLLALTPQQQRDNKPSPVGTGRIAGTVVDHESGRPVRFAMVSLASEQVHRMLITDGSGTFAFDQLAAGAYRVSVTKAGYLETAYGQARPGTDTPGKFVVLGDRQPVARIVIPLSHGGVISGTVRDERGDPVFDATVSVSRWMTSYGVRQLEEVASTRSDERGNYRLALLAPRDYVLSAAPSEVGVPQPMPPSANHVGDPDYARIPFDFASMFFPGVPSATDAESIRLGLGEMRTNVDLTLPLVAIGTLSGVVLEASGKPAGGVEVTLLTPREITNGEVGRTETTDRDGRFGFEKIVPGAYTLMATTFEPREEITLHASSFRKTLSGSSSITITRAIQGAGTFEPDPKPAPRPPAFAWSEVSVTGGSVSNVTLTLEPPRKVTGRFLFEGRAKPHSPKDISVELITIRGPHGADTTVTANDDGTFDIDNLLPGRYAINVALNGVGVVPWALTSAVVGGVDILDTFLEVPRDRDVRDLTITFRDRETELSGAVIDSAGHSAGERIVVVFPSDDKLWAGHMRVQAMPLSSDGGYAFRELRPGRYLVAVVDGVETGEWLDAAFLRNLIPSAVPVTLAEGERRVQDLRVR